MRDDIQQHCAVIEACNQRGGRMLSIVDLIEAGTFAPDLAAYALAAIGKGASFMVGALPGGAGKTTVMGALLNFVPAGIQPVAADGLATIEQGIARRDPLACYICHEIGDGGYFAYLWGGVLRRYFELPAAGHMLATNLHADTYEQAQRQVCRDNGVPEAAFQRMNLLFFLSLNRTGGVWGRRIATVWESDGKTPHRCVLPDASAAFDVATSRLVSLDEHRAARTRLDRILASGARSIQEVRRQVVTLYRGAIHQ